MWLVTTKDQAIRMMEEDIESLEGKVMALEEEKAANLAEIKGLGKKHHLSMTDVTTKDQAIRRMEEDMASLQDRCACQIEQLDEAKNLIAQMHRSVCGKFKKAGIGVKLSMAKEDGAQRRVILHEIISGGPADLGGELQCGDAVVSIDGVEVCNMSEQYIRSMLAGPVGTSVSMTLKRDAEAQRCFEVTLLRRSNNLQQTVTGQALEVSDCAHALFVELEQMSARCAVLSSDIEVRQIHVDGMDEMNGKLQIDLSRCTDDMQHLRRRIEALETELDKAQTSSTDMDRRIQHVMSERDAASNQISTANEKIKQLNALLEETQRELHSQSLRQQQSAKENAGTIADLRSSISRYESQMSLLKLEIERVQGESRRHLVESDSVKQQILASKETNTELRVLLMQSREENKRLSEHLESEKKKREGAESSLSIAIAGSMRLDVEKADVSSAFSELEQQHQLVASRLEEAQESLHACRRDNTRLENEKDDLEAARMVAMRSLDQALREIEGLKEEGEQASQRLKTELENAGDVVQHQAELHASVLREKGIVEAELTYFKGQATSLQERLESATKEAGRLQGRITALDSALAAEKITAQRETAEKLSSQQKEQSLRDQICDAMAVCRTAPDNAEDTLLVSVRRLVRHLESKTHDALRLEGELGKIQAAYSETSVEVRQLLEKAHKEAQDMRELQCDNEALESKLRELGGCLDKERANVTELTTVNKALRAQVDKTTKHLISVQDESRQLDREAQQLGSALATKEQELAALKQGLRELEGRLSQSTSQGSRAAEMLAQSERARERAVDQARDISELLAAADNASRHLQARNSSLDARLHRSMEVGRDLLQHVSSLRDALRVDGEISVQEGFARESMRKEILRKEQALEEMGRSMATAQQDRDMLVATKLQFENLSHAHSANVRRLGTAQTKLKQLLEGVSVAHGEMQGVVLEFGLAMGIVDRQVGRTTSELRTLLTQHASVDQVGSDAATLSSSDLIASLMQLEHLREMLDAGKEAQRAAEQKQSQEAMANLKHQVSEASELIRCLERDRSEIDTEREEHQILTRKLQLSEQRELAGQLQCKNLEQELARARNLLHATKHHVGSAIKEIVRLARDAAADVNLANDCFTVSHAEIRVFKETLFEFFSGTQAGLDEVSVSLHAQEAVNEGLKSQLVMALAVGGSMARDLAFTEEKLVSTKSDVCHHVHTMSALLEEAKDEVRHAAWALESNCVDAEAETQLQKLELVEVQQEMLVSKDKNALLECEKDELQQQLSDATVLAEARKRELDELSSRMRRERAEADRALSDMEETMGSIKLVRAELQSAEKERELRAQEAWAAERETQALKAMCEEQIVQLRSRLHTHTSTVQERIVTLQAESEEIYSAITDIYKELGHLRAEFQREMISMNSKMGAYDAQHEGMREMLAYQERELACRENEVVKVAANLEVLIDQLRDGEARQRHTHARLVQKLRNMQVAVNTRHGMHRLLVRSLKVWRQWSRRHAWALWASDACKARRLASSILSLIQLCFRRWTLRNHHRVAVTRWELLAVGATVCGLDRVSRKGRLLSTHGVKKRMRTRVDRVEPSDDSSTHSGRASNRSDDAVFPHGMAALRLNLKTRRAASDGSHSWAAKLTPTSRQMDDSSLDYSTTGQMDDSSLDCSKSLCTVDSGLILSSSPGAE